MAKEERWEGKGGQRQKGNKKEKRKWELMKEGKKKKKD